MSDPSNGGGRRRKRMLSAQEKYQIWVCHERSKEVGVKIGLFDAVLHRRWRGRPGGLVVLRGRPAGGGRKPPQAAAVKSRGGERLRKRRAVERVRCGPRRRAQAIH